MKGLKRFLIQGNVIDLAAAFALGAAFNSVVQSFVADFLTPLLSALGGLPDFSSLKVTVGRSDFLYGHFVNAAISFLMISAAIYFLVVRPYRQHRDRTAATVGARTRDCPECLSKIPKAASRCAFCTAQMA
ncbi:large conductance mechanosensitive channel protein MscL [Nonomuraea sp. NPDC050786]|uniref:large conductance mechanosensitive channel protein MscL n=1 Tax=Nonomuraea sp. NPDC050786 TaxID=3154840 RepID=UPI00340EAC89